MPLKSIKVGLYQFNYKTTLSPLKFIAHTIKDIVSTSGNSDGSLQLTLLLTGSSQSVTCSQQFPTVCDHKTGF